MTRRIIACLWRNGKPEEWHEFPLPGMCDKGYYRTAVSYDCFRNRENSRLYEANLKGIRDLPIRTSLNHEEEHSGWQGFRFLNKPFPETQKHADLWSFYKAIGYDYKKKKYA